MGIENRLIPYDLVGIANFLEDYKDNSYLEGHNYTHMPVTKILESNILPFMENHTLDLLTDHLNNYMANSTSRTPWKAAGIVHVVVLWTS